MKNKAGRPTKKEIWKQRIAYGVTKMTDEVIAKLEQAFAIGATRAQACDYADVDPSTLWRWEQKNPELSNRFQRMREKLPLKAKMNIAQSVHQGTITDSKYVLEKMEPETYAEKLKIEHTDTATDGVHAEDEQVRQELKKKLIENIRRRSKDIKDKKNESA